jgi:UDP-N-acetylglucosamine--N-acetylmuramyl-(pentapeptide) pyrophosphoryl-undecaprenol N-acetylglucosamine transferase
MPRPPHIVFAGGGTPGHLHPGLAVAAHLMERIPDATVTFIGGGRGVDRHVIRAAGFGFSAVPSQPAPENPLDAVRFVTDNVAGYWAARWMLREKRVSAVVGLGGASSAPTVRAAISRGIPTLMLEQNVVPGRVTRWLARSATMVCAGFNETRGYFPSAVPITITGNPARPAFERMHRELRSGCLKSLPQDLIESRCELSESDKIGSHTRLRASANDTLKRLVVIGGAGGARSLNEELPAALARLREQLAGWQVVHQSGEGQLQATEQRYRAAGVDALVVAFIDELAPVMFASDLVICRPGGTTLAELAMASVPAILVPYPRVMDYHLPNAEIFAAAGAATIIDESEPEIPLKDALVGQLESLLTNDERRAKMAASMRRLARPGAAANVTNLVYEQLFNTSVRIAA